MKEDDLQFMKYTIIKNIANRIKSSGGNLYLVGGAIRDRILNIENHDEDYCVTGISFDEFSELFPNAIIRGKDFPVFLIDNKEFAIARKERKIGIGHKNFDIETDKRITIEEDLERRDITINAIAQNVLTNEIIDPFDGKKDLKNGIIRAIGNHFSEDPLRAYRVARFATKFNFDVEENTIKMMNSLKRELKSLSAERVYNELSRALLTDRPSIFFNVLKKANILDVHFKEIFDLIGAEQPAEFHPEGDSYKHTMIVLDKVSNITEDLDDERKLELRFSALVHDIGKGATPKSEYPHHKGHEKMGAKKVRELGNRLKLPTRLVKCGITACEEHMRGGIFDKMTPAKKVSFIERIDKTLLGLDGLQIIVDADNMSEVVDINQFAEVGRKIIDCVNGKEVMERYNLMEGVKVASKMHEFRVEYLKKIYER